MKRNGIDTTVTNVTFAGITEAKKMGTTTIRLPEEIIQYARITGRVEHRKPAQQIEYWIEIAKCAIDNPDLSFTEIKETLQAMAEAEVGDVTEYTFG